MVGSARVAEGEVEVVLDVVLEGGTAAPVNEPVAVDWASPPPEQPAAMFAMTTNGTVDSRSRGRCRARDRIAATSCGRDASASQARCSRGNTSTS